MPNIDWEQRVAMGMRLFQFLEVCKEADMEQVRGNVLDLILINIPHRVTAMEDIVRLGSSNH
jgi:hypothetical protein